MAETALGELQGCIHIMWISIVFVVICTANIHVYCKDQIYLQYIFANQVRMNPQFFVDLHFESLNLKPFSHSVSGNPRKAIDQRDLKAATQIIEGVGGSQEIQNM